MFETPDAGQNIITRGLPKTGRTYAWRTGDDGYFEAGWWVGTTFPHLKTRFIAKTIGGDDIVIDRATGLMWVADVDTPICNDSMPLTWNLAIDLPLATAFAGFNDWRIPNILELLSIVHFARANPAIKQPPFVNTVSSNYWSSTTKEGTPANAWCLHMASGGMLSKDKTHNWYLRCVRGGI